MLDARDRLQAHASENGHGDKERAELWLASVSTYNARRRRENIVAWIRHHEEQIARHRQTLKNLIARHKAEIAKLKAQLGGE